MNGYIQRVERKTIQKGKNEGKEYVRAEVLLQDGTTKWASSFANLDLCVPGMAVGLQEDGKYVDIVAFYPEHAKQDGGTSATTPASHGALPAVPLRAFCEAVAWAYGFLKERGIEGHEYVAQAIIAYTHNPASMRELAAKYADEPEPVKEEAYNFEQVYDELPF